MDEGQSFLIVVRRENEEELKAKKCENFLILDGAHIGFGENVLLFLRPKIAVFAVM